MSSATRGNRNLNGANSNSRGNSNRRYGNGQGGRTNNSTATGGGGSGSGNQQRGWGNQNVSTSSGATLNTRGGHQQRASSYGGGVSPADLDAQKHMHDRVIYLLAKSVGSFTIVTVATGARYRGILVAATTSGDIGAVLELAEKYAPAPGEEDDINSAPEKFDKILFQAKDLVDIEIESPNLAVEKATSTVAVSSGSEFKTDTDISGQKGAFFERKLQPWSAGDDSSPGLSLEDTPQSSMPWDQFSVNQSKFGVNSTYDEHLYTTVIDRSHPEYQMRERRAEQIAGEIMKSSYNGNVHLAEERGITVDDSGMDEEDKYSGVDRRLPAVTRLTPAVSLPRSPNKYTPPSQRAPPGGAKNNKGVPYDPAIVSSSLAAPDGSSSRKASQSGLPTDIAVGGTSTPISDLFKASQGVTTAEQSSPASSSTTAPVSANKPIPPSVALPASARAGKLKPDKDITKLKGSGKAPIDTEGIQRGLAGDFKVFVSTQVEKVHQKKHYLHLKEMTDKIDSFKKFSQGYKISTPVPLDLVPILGKPKDNSVTYASLPVTSSARATGGSASTSAAVPASKPVLTTSASQPIIQPALPPTASPAKPSTDLSAKIALAHKSNLPLKVPSPLPAVKQHKTVVPVSSPAQKTVQPSPSPGKAVASASSSNTSVPPEKKLNLNFKAPEFRPNPAAHAFTPSFAPPVSTTSSSHASPALSHPQPALTPRQNRPGNLYFGNKALHNKSTRGRFNPFLRVKEEASQGSNVAPIIDRAFLTPPTWPAPVDKSYTEFLPNDNAQRPYYMQRGPMGIPPPSPALNNGASMVPMMQPGFEDPNLRNMMANSTPPISGQVAFIPGMGYSQYGGAPQFFGRAPQPFPMPNMMSQGAYMGFNPQQGYQSPRGPQAMLVPAMNQQGGFNMGGGGGYYSPQQQHQQPYRNNGGGHNNHNPRYGNNNSHGGHGGGGGGGPSGGGPNAGDIQGGGDEAKV